MRTPPKIRRPHPAPRAASRAMQALEAAIGQAATDAERSAVLDRFWAGAAQTPLIEASGDGETDHVIVTFVWRDASAEEVLLFVNRITDETDLPASAMHAIPGTDVWHLSYRMRTNWRASYGMVTRAPGQQWPWQPGDQRGIRNGLDRSLRDPRNPATITNRVGTLLSLVQLDAAPSQPYLARRDGLLQRGSVAALDGPGGVRLWVYQPPGAVAARGDDGDRDPSALPIPDGRYPAVIVFDGDVWVGTHHFADTMDNLVADAAIRPAYVLFIDSADRRQRWRELSAGGELASWVAVDLLEWARQRYPISTDPADIVVAGQSLGGYTALRTVIEHPDAVRKALSQSASLWQRDLSGSLDRVGAAPEAALQHLHFYIEVGAQEWVLREPNLTLARELAARGAEVTAVEYNGGHDYACWRGGMADGLTALLPPHPAG